MKIVLNKDEVMDILCKHFGCTKDALSWEGNPQEAITLKEIRKEKERK